MTDTAMDAKTDAATPGELVDARVRITELEIQNAALESTVARLNERIPEFAQLHRENAQLKTALAASRATSETTELDALEAKWCPEDWGLDEYLGFLVRNRAELEQENARLAAAASAIKTNSTDSQVIPASAPSELEALRADAAAWRAHIARRFPIQDGDNIPWTVIEAHEHQAIENHDQDLETLASRGGLSVVEAIHVLRDAPLYGTASTRIRQLSKTAAAAELRVLAGAPHTGGQ